MLFINRKRVRADFEEESVFIQALMKSDDDEIAVIGRLFLQYRRKLLLIKALPFWVFPEKRAELKQRAIFRHNHQCELQGLAQYAIRDSNPTTSEDDGFLLVLTAIIG